MFANAECKQLKEIKLFKNKTTFDKTLGRAVNIYEGAVFMCGDYSRKGFAKLYQFIKMFLFHCFQLYSLSILCLNK